MINDLRRKLRAERHRRAARDRTAAQERLDEEDKIASELASVTIAHREGGNG
jgi:hypothetical protein